MGYIALYRNYRPTNFSEVAGQKYIIKTLKNGVINNKISHAYIFSGQRGIGKTTIARILAKAVNCLEPINGEPCNHCKNCLSIINNETSDIVEIDAASNNGVDEMRDLLEKVNFLPSTLKKKVYIIDEVHMLSISAFNALLKTLEEPPAHVMFVLATTEPHKIPMTILSRCQRFDFKQLSNEEITNKLAEICEKEEILIDDDALYAIAEASEGGMRDAISILDQVSAYAESVVTTEDVDNVTGKISNYKLTELIKTFLKKNAVEALRIINELLEIGKEPSRIINNLINFCRDILLYKNDVTLEESKKIYTQTDFKELADEIDIPTLFYYIDVLVDASNKIKYTNSSKLYLEVAIMKIISSSKDNNDIRIDQLEEKLKHSNIVSSSDSEVKIAEIELKVKKITEELNRLGLEAFKESTLGKLTMLEEVSLNKATIPSTIDSKLEELENSLNQLRASEYNTQSMYRDLLNRINALGETEEKEENPDLLNRIISLENKYNNTDASNEKAINPLEEDILFRLETLEKIVNSQKDIVQSNQSDDTMRDLLERMTKVESDLVNLPKESSNTSDELFETILTDFDNLSKEVKELEDKFSLAESKQVNNITVSPDISEYKAEVAVLKENYFTIINSLQKMMGDKIYEEEDLDEKPAPVDVDVIKEDILKDTIEAIAVVKDEIDSKFKENQTIICELSQKIEDLNNSQEIVQIKEQINSIDKKASDLNTKIEEYHPIELEKEIEEIKKLTNDIKDYNLNLKVKYDELEKQVKAFNVPKISEPVENPIVSELKPRVQEEPIIKPVEQIRPEPIITQPVEKKVEPKLAEKPIVSETKPRMVEQIDDTQKVFDIKIVERILHESRTKEARVEKIKLVNEWSKISNSIGNNTALSATASLLRDGTLTANGQSEILIVYSDASVCNHLMSTRVHKEAKEVLKMAFGREYDFMALPENTWQEKRKEYYSQYAIGISKPVLSEIRNPNLRAIVTKEEPKKEGTFDRVSSFFGTNNIRKED